MTWDNVEGNSVIKLSYRVISTDIRTVSGESQWKKEPLIGDCSHR